MCVLSVRIYAKGAALPVRLRAVGVGPVPRTPQGEECGAGAVECSFCRCLLNTSSHGAVTSPAGPLLLERKSWGRPFRRPPTELAARSSAQCSRESLSGDAGPSEPSGGKWLLNCRVQAGAARPAAPPGQAQAGTGAASGGAHCVAPKGDNLAFHGAPSQAPLAQLADSAWGRGGRRTRFWGRGPQRGLCPVTS